MWAVGGGGWGKSRFLSSFVVRVLEITISPSRAYVPQGLFQYGNNAYHENYSICKDSSISGSFL